MGTFGMEVAAWLTGLIVFGWALTLLLRAVFDSSLMGF